MRGILLARVVDARKELETVVMVFEGGSKHVQWETVLQSVLRLETVDGNRYRIDGHLSRGTFGSASMRESGYGPGCMLTSQRDGSTAVVDREICTCICFWWVARVWDPFR
jgi:hypothetical protein